MRRMTPMAAGLVAVGVVFGALFGGGFGPVLPAVLLLLVPAGLLLRRRLHVGHELAWTGPATRPAPMVVAPAAHRGRPGLSVSLALARFEARELVTSPWLGAGVGFLAVIFVVFGLIFEEDNERSWLFLGGLTPVMVHPFVGMIVVGAHRAVTRGRRDECEELFQSCPADRPTRLLGHLGTAWVPAAIAIGFVIGLLALIGVRNPALYGPIDGRLVASVLLCAVLGAGGVALGTALGRWVPWTAAGVVAVIAVAVVDFRLGDIGGDRFATDRYLATGAIGGNVDPLFLPAPYWGRLVWLAALTCVVAAAAVIGHRRRRAVLGVLAATAAIAVVGAAAVVRPIDRSTASEVAGMVADPAGHQVCEPAGGGVAVCTYRPYAEFARLMASEVRPVAEALPHDVLDGVQMRHEYDQPLTDVAPEVAAALGGRKPPRSADSLRLRYQSHPETRLAARMRLAARAVGLPTEAGEGQRPRVVAGQARGVIVLWLAGVGKDEGVVRSLTKGSNPPDRAADATDRGTAWPGICHGEDAVLQWSGQDLAAARILLERPAAEVGEIVRGGWARFTDPTTTTDELLAAAGLGPVGPADAVEARPVTCG